MEPFEDGLLLAGKRGLLQLAEGAQAPQRIVEREVLGLARVGSHLVLTDGASVFVSTPELLRAQRVVSEVPLARGFAPGRVRGRRNAGDRAGGRMRRTSEVSGSER